MKNYIHHKLLKKYFLLFFIVLFGTQTTQAQLEPDVLWVKQFGGPELDLNRDIAMDYLGNIYTTGFFRNTANFGDIILTAPGSSAPFVVKTDPSGQVLWAKQFGGTGLDVGHGITTDTNGNVYTTGIFTSTVSFGSITLSTSTEPSTFVVKQDTDGNVLWASKFADINEQENVYSKAIAIDIQNNIYTAGYFHSTADFGGIVLTKEHDTSFNAFLVKQDENGNVLWAKKIGETASVDIYKLATDSSGNIYITGKFNGTVNFDGVPNISSIYGKGFVLKLDSFGNTIWVKYFGDENHIASSGFEIYIDNTNNVYVTGNFEGIFSMDTITISGQNTNMFVLKMDNNDNALWIRSFELTSASVSLSSVVTDDFGNVYVAGTFSGSIYFEELSTSLTAYVNDAIMLKMDSSGLVKWADKTSSYYNNSASGIVVGSAGELYVVGSFNGGMNFFNTFLSSYENSRDIFLAKFVLEDMSIDQNKISELKIYPNPINDFLTIDISDKDVILSAEIVNLLGQKIKIFDNINNTQNLDLSDLSSGIYFLNLINQNQEKQIIKIKKL